MSPRLLCVERFHERAGGYGRDCLYRSCDLEIGAKILVVDEKGFVKNGAHRLVLTSGVSVPLEQFDAEAEFDNFMAGDAFCAHTTSGHGSLGLGVKTDTEYMINDMFFLNLHGQDFYYMPSQRAG